MRNLFVFFLCLPLLASCTAANTYCPPQLHISPDGATVAFFSHHGSFSGTPHPHEISFINLNTGRLTRVALPWGAAGQNLIWLPGKLLVLPQGNNSRNYLIDSLTHSLAPVHGLNLAGDPYPPFPATYRGQPAFFAGAGLNKETIFALPQFTPIAHLDFAAQGIDDGFMLRYHFTSGAPPFWTSQGWLREEIGPDGQRSWRSPSVAAVDLLDSDARIVSHFDPEQLAKGALTTAPLAAALSPDHHALMLAPAHTSFFATAAWSPNSVRPYYNRNPTVFEIPSGKFLYQAHGDGSIISPAALLNDAVYAISEFVPSPSTDPAAPRRTPTRADHQLWLTRYTARGSEKLLRLPLSPSLDAFTPNFSNTFSPDKKFLLIDAPAPDPHHLRLLQIPLTPHPTPADIREIEIAVP